MACDRDVNRNADPQAATAVTYHACAKLLFHPESTFQWAVLENVMALGQKQCGQALSDAQWIVEDFRRHQWSCAEMELEASDYGSPALRQRKIFVAFKGRNADEECRLEKD